MKKLITLDRKHWGCLLEYLASCGPTTYKLQGTMRCALRGIRQTECFVDRWPEPITIITECTFPIFTEESYSVHTTDPQNFKQILLDNIEKFDWTKKQYFGGISPEVKQILEDVIKDKDVSVKVNGPGCVHEAVCDSHEMTSPPVGFQFSSLDESHTDLVTSRWDYSDTETRDFIQFVLSEFLSVSLLTEGGAIAGWIMEQPYGAQGMLYLSPEYRGRGLSKYLVLRHRDEMMRQNKLVYSYINTDNQVSITLHQSCNYQKRDGECYWFNVTPRYNANNHK